MLGHILIQIPEDDQEETVSVYLSNHQTGDSTSGEFSDMNNALIWAREWFGN